MKKLVWIFFVFHFPFPSFSQYSSIDHALDKIPRSKKKSIEALCEYIKENSTSDLERVRGVYYWISNNIRYDARRYFKDKQSFVKAEDVFRKRKAVCEGYSNLFMEMCIQMNLECYVVSGYDKGYGYKIGQPLYESSHAWNAVKIGEEWHLCDATWASGEVHKRIFRKFVPKFNDEYFDVKPKELILTHLPELPMWQLLEYPVSIKLFNGDEKKLYAFLKNPTSEKINCNDTIQKWLSDTMRSGVNYGLMAFRFNSQNPLPLAFGKQDLMENIINYKLFPYEVSGRMYEIALRKLHMSELDSIIELANESISLLKNAKATKKSTRESIEGNIAWDYDKISEMYFQKADKQLNIFKYIKVHAFDTLLLYTKPSIESINKSMKANLETGNGNQFKNICQESFNKYSLSREPYTRFLEEESSEEKKKTIQKEIDLLIASAKKNIPVNCKCYKEILTW